MNMITSRNHFNPASWLAAWSYETNSSSKARYRKLRVLSFLADKIYSTAADKVHFARFLGTATITAVERREFLARYGQMPIGEADLGAEYTLDLEPVYTAIEKLDFYKAVSKAIASRNVPSTERVSIAMFAVAQMWRHPTTMYEILAQRPELKKSQLLLEYWTRFGDADLLRAQLDHLVTANWILHTAHRDLFPLGDRAVLLNSDFTRLWMALSPQLLLEICLNERARGRAPKHRIRHFDENKDRSITENYRRLTIQNAFGEIVFSNRDVLETWRDSIEYRDRRECLAADSGAIDNYR